MMAAGNIPPIVFPDPGKPDGIRTYRKPVMTMKNISFRYEGTENWVLTDASVTVTLGSRVVLLGANGAGKTTFLKLLIGDLELDAEAGHKGEGWRHHNLRVSYIAQHSLHHLEDYLQETPMHYIQERFRFGMDRELAKLKTLALTDDEKEQTKEIGQINDVIGRQQRGKQMWYEVKTGRREGDTQWFPLEELNKTYPTTSEDDPQLRRAADGARLGDGHQADHAAEILQHLADFGIDQTLAHGKIRQMSGGQQRASSCSAFWSKPHLIALDEPTNYLDQDTLAALTQALKNFKGAVVTVLANMRRSSPRSPTKSGSSTRRSSASLRDAKAR